MAGNPQDTSWRQGRESTEPARRLRPFALRRASTVTATVLALAGCSLDGLVNSDELPPDVTDPAITKTPEGAMAAYQGTIVAFRRAFGGRTIGLTDGSGFVSLSGVFTDELQNGAVFTPFPFQGGVLPVDQRDLPENSSQDVDVVRAGYSVLQHMRGQGSQAIGLLSDYVPDRPVLKGHVYALEGYAEVFLAELFCSGIPLSTLDYHGDFTPLPGSITSDVFTHAVTLFDSALALAGDSARIMDLARVGKGRALLALGEYEQAATSVASVTSDYSYEVRFGPTLSGSTVGGDDPANFALVGVEPWLYHVPDHEGGHGLDYVSSNDPRTAVEDLDGRNHPLKYAVDGSSPIVLASGIEARLIEAEAALQAVDPETWLAKLNALRTDGTQNGGVYNSGTGGVAGLAPLADPGTTEEQVNLLFRERAFWLFLTGHRQGDLRRLIRQYGRSHDEFYPTGSYPSGGFYGGDVTFPIPSDERLSNPKFTGCASRGA